MLLTINSISRYIADIDQTFRTGIATEHSYRPALQSLIESIPRPLQVTNEPRRIACGAPDFVVTRNLIPVGYIEAKDIESDLNSNAYMEQFDRYKNSLTNLIITDYLTFHLYIDGSYLTSATIARKTNNRIVYVPEQLDFFQELINRFVAYDGIWIKTSIDLSRLMAAKAKLMASVIEKSLNNNDSENAGNNTLDAQFNAFRQVLANSITSKEFADIYAQTIAYGMFSAKLNDNDNLPFTRSRAAELIPHSNPFLRRLFQYIAGYDLDSRIQWIVDDLAHLFDHVDINAIYNEFDRRDHNPVIHFYELFLSQYDPALRRSRGVWYTPKPVVQFIVQAVDDILKNDFSLPEGLADSSKIQLSAVPHPTNNTTQYHRVQILDPATGTGTFLAEIVKSIHAHFTDQQGMWQNYVHEHLIPRINGLEILMASYAMAHLNIDMLLHQTGYNHAGNERLHIYLTNSLDEARPDSNIPFAQWLSDESNQANRIKRDTPVMVVLGNPPYSGESQNSSPWIARLMNDYKREPSGIRLQERNPKWINDDYVKFIRFSQYFINKNGEGILAFINNHSFLDNPTFRGMRYNLLKTFDKIYILDLHGNAKKKETAPDGGRDENVFNIQPGVSINIFVKTRNPNPRHCVLNLNQNHPQPPTLATVFHSDLYGERPEKFSFLSNNSLQSIPWRKVELTDPMYFFVPKNFSLKEEYENGFKLDELFSLNSMGIATARDNFTIHYTPQSLRNTINEFINLDIETARNKFLLGDDVRDWSVSGAKNDLTSNPDFSKIADICYRPFDNRYTYYTGKSKGFHCMPRDNVMHHFINGQNIGLCLIKVSRDYHFSVFITNLITDKTILSSKDNSNVFPLYLYLEGYIEDGRRMPGTKIPNLNLSIITEISQHLQLQFTEEPAPDAPNVPEVPQSFSPIDIFDYIYAILHSPTYRERYKEFLKIDFPRLPYPQDAEQFWSFAGLGSILRRLHLMEGVEPQEGLANFPIPGSNQIENLEYIPPTPSNSPSFDGFGLLNSCMEDDSVGGRVYINNRQYFDHVPPEAWNFYIGGYQPAQKWLKDRKGRILSYDDIRHYQRIIVALLGTFETMNAIDAIEL